MSRIHVSALIFYAFLLQGLSLSAHGQSGPYSSGEVASVLRDTSHPDHGFLKSIFLRMVRVSRSSGTIVAVSEAGQGLVFSAYHVTSGGKGKEIGTDMFRYFGFSGAPTDPGSRRILVRSPYPGQNRRYDTYPASVIHHPVVDLPNSDPIDGIYGIPVKMDYIIGAVDVKASYYSKLSEELQIRSAKPGEKVILLGFPGQNVSQLSYTTGLVATDVEAKERIEGSGSKVSYQPGIESVVLGAEPGSGFSGGAVFGYDGKFLGVISRGFAPPREGRTWWKKSYGRFILANYILSEVLKAASEPRNKSFKKYLGPKLLNQIQEHLRNAPVSPSGDGSKASARGLKCGGVLI